MRRAVIALWTGALVSTLLAIGTGRTLDDYMHAALVEDGHVLTLYDFFGAERVAELRHAGPFLAWWADDDLSMRFFRPLSSLLLTVDHRLLDGGGLLSHLHGLVWYVALLYVVWRVLSETIGAQAARFGTPLYALSSWHAVPLAFTAARHVHVTAVFALLALLHFCRAVRQRRLIQSSGGFTSSLLAALWLTLGLLAGESAILAVPLAFGWAAGAGGVHSAFKLGAPMLGVATLYGIGYAWAGYGTTASGMYLSPTEVQFYLDLPARWLALSADLFGGVPNDLTLFGLRPLQVAWGSVAVVALAVVLHWVNQTRESRVAPVVGLVWGACVALIPASGAMPGGRALVIPGVAAAALFGHVAQRLVHRPAPETPQRAVHHTMSRPMQTRWIALWVVVFSIGLHPVIRLIIPMDFARLGKEVVTWSRELSAKCAGRVVLGLGMLEASAVYPPVVMRAHGLPPVRAMHLLSMSSQLHELVRLSDDVYELTVGGDFFANPWSRVSRNRPLDAGMVVELEGLRVSVLQTEPQTRLRLHLHADTPVCWTTSTPQGPALMPVTEQPLSWVPGE